MKRLLPLFLLAVLATGFTACSTPEERSRREARHRQEDREDRRREAKYDEEDFQDFLEDYADDLDKKPSQLTASERAEARREFNRDGRSGRRGYYRRSYWGW